MTSDYKLGQTYYRLSTFYFFFFATLGAFVPYWSVYLKSIGFEASEIGELMAVVMASKIIAPYFLGWMADHFQKRLKIIKISFLLTLIFFAGVFVNQNYWWMVLIMAVFGFFWNASLPLFEALALNHLQGESNRYGQIRLWGSIGFIVLVIIIPLFIQNGGISKLPLLVFALLILTGLSTFLIKDRGSFITAIGTQKISQIISSPIVLAFLFACILQGISHGAYYTFFSIYLEDHGYSRLVTGWMWGLGVIAEVVLFIFMHRLFVRFNACLLFTLALALTTLRWVMLSIWVDEIALLILSQSLHAASFGLFHATAIHLIHQFFPGKFQSRGQALYAGLSFGLGGAIGNLLSGYSWDILGSTTTFVIAAAFALVATLVSMIYVRKENYPKQLNIGNI